MAYTYRIKWIETGMSYYGVRYAKNCCPSELWSVYFTSSNYVKQYRKIYGEPDIIEIRKLFTSVEKARIWEQKVITRLQAHKRKDFLNRTNNISIYNPTLSEEHKKLISKSRKGKKNQKLADMNKLKIGDLNPSRNPLVRAKLSSAKSGHNNPMFGKIGSSHPRYGKIGASIGKKWYYDPINNKEIYCFENTQPTQYLLGRLKRKKKG